MHALQGKRSPGQVRVHLSSKSTTSNALGFTCASLVRDARNSVIFDLFLLVDREISASRSYQQGMRRRLLIDNACGKMNLVCCNMRREMGLFVEVLC